MVLLKHNKDYFNNNKNEHKTYMAYSQTDKESLMQIVEKHNFDIKNSVFEFNQKNGHNLSRTTVYKWIDEDNYFKKEFELRLNELLDEAEVKHRLIRQGIPIYDEETKQLIAWQEKPDRAALEFFLKTKGRPRGYIEKTENETTIKQKQVLIIVQSEKTKDNLEKLHNEDD